MIQKNYNRKENRYIWIDFAKYISIIAVVIDHTYGVLYDNKTIAIATYFSVSLFILLSGMSAALSNQNNVKNFQYQIRKISKLLFDYLVATFVLFIFYRRFFNLKEFLIVLLNFEIQSPYYFLVFYIQLVFITPILMFWYNFCKNNEYRVLLHTLTLFLFLFLSSIFIRYTFILPVYGGGRFLFGGTYFLIYYIGILLSPINTIQFFKTWKIEVFISSFIFWLIWLFLISMDIVNLDVFFVHIFGKGINPPSFNLTIYAIVTLFLLYTFFEVLFNFNSNFIRSIILYLSELGQYTLYIFMYHLLVKDIIQGVLPEITNIWLIRVLIFIPMITLPALIAIILKKIRLNFISKQIIN